MSTNPVPSNLKKKDSLEEKSVPPTPQTTKDEVKPKVENEEKKLDEKKTDSDDHPELPEESKRAIESEMHREASIDVKAIRGKWQMASCAHFFEVFGDVLPFKEISVETAEDLTPNLLERAIAEPESDTRACLALRDIIMTLLLANEIATKKNIYNSWFLSLRVFISSRGAEFIDCFHNNENVLNSYENGMDFLVSVGWKIRLGLLLALCDITAQESQVIRDVIRESEQATTAAKSEIEAKEYRLIPLGRCSQKRFHYKIGKTRVYSGYKRKGTGTLLVECTDSRSMGLFADALSQSSHQRDRKLSNLIKEKHLAPLIELEEKMRKKMERKLFAEIQKEESRRRNAGRPRRSKASYMLD